MVEENQKETIDLASNKVNVDAFPKEEELSLDVVEEKEATVRPTLYIKNRGKLEVQFIEH